MLVVELAAELVDGSELAEGMDANAVGLTELLVLAVELGAVEDEDKGDWVVDEDTDEDIVPLDDCVGDDDTDVEAVLIGDWVDDGDTDVEIVFVALGEIVALVDEDLDGVGLAVVEVVACGEAEAEAEGVGTPSP